MTPEQLGQFIGRINDAKTWHELWHMGGELFDDDDNPIDGTENLRELISVKKKRFQPRDGGRYIYHPSGWDTVIPPIGEPNDGDIVQVEDQSHGTKAADSNGSCYIVSADGAQFLGQVSFASLYPIPENKKEAAD